MPQAAKEKKDRQATQQQSKWDELRGLMRSEIMSGSWSPGHAIPGQNHLAVTYDVSVNTVREAVAALVHEGLLIRQRGKKTVVSPQLNRPGLSIDVFAFLSVHASGTDRRAMVEMLAGISNAIKQFGLTMTLHRLVPAPDGPEEADIETIVRSSEGVLAVHRVRDALLPACRMLKCPFVVVDGLGDAGAFPQATYDRRESARIATEHARQRGHGRIAHIGLSTRGLTEMQRQMGFLDVVRGHDLDLPGGYLVQCARDFGALRDATRKLLRCRPRPTCICCSTDSIAMTVLTVLLEEGIRIPDDIALISFTDDPAAADAPVSLSGVYQPFEEIGFESVRLLQRIVGGEAGKTETVLIPPRLVVRESC